MGISLNGLTPAGTYPGLIKTGDNTAISGTPKVLSDGNGNNLPMEVSTTGVNFTNQLQQGGVAVPTASQVAAKQDTLVSGTNIKTINGTSVLGSGNIAVVTSPSGVSGAIQFSNGSAFASDAANLFWDDTNNRLGVGLNTPATTLDILPPVQTATGTQFDCFRVGYSNSTIGVTNGSALQVQVATTGSGRYSTTLRLSGSSDTSQAYLKGFASNNFGVMLNRANSNLGLFSDNGIKLGDTAFAGSEGVASGMVHIKGSGSTFATNSFLVQNNSGTNLMRIRDDGQVFCEGGGAFSSAGIIGTLYGLFGGASYEPSASLVCGGTTTGFLPPRMTTTQINAIASPANGLEVYNTTLACPCFYDGTAWRKVSHTTM